MSKSFDFDKRNFENLKGGADYFVSLLKDYISDNMERAAFMTAMKLFTA